MHMFRYNTVRDIREELVRLLVSEQFTDVNRERSMTSLVGSKTIEIVGASFLVTEETIFGKPDHGYIKREEEWYDSMSRNIEDFPGGAPSAWKAVASRDGLINSNYGYLVYSEENCSQYANVLTELKKNPESRRAEIIYTRPSMWKEYNENGRSDFICTDSVQYLIRDGVLSACVRMRSSDVSWGFKNDYAWQKTVLSRLATDLNNRLGVIYWNAGSLHVYARHFYLVDHYSKTGETSITKSKYKELYPGSRYVELL